MERPPVDVRDLLERLRVGVVEVSTVDTDDDADECSGQLSFEAGTAQIRLCSTESEERRRFTLAMFLGHLMRDPEGSYSRHSSGRPPTKCEKASLVFASDLLVPRAWLDAALAQETMDDSVTTLATLFKVSPAAMQTAIDRARNDSDPLVDLGLPANLPEDDARLRVEQLLEEYAPERFKALPADVQGYCADRREEIEDTWRCARLYRALPAGILRFEKMTEIPAPEEVRDVLTGARTLIATRGWCQRAQARDGYGRRVVRWDDPAAGTFNPVGAIRRSAVRQVSASELAQALFAQAVGVDSWHQIAAWNDDSSRRREEVLKAFTDALALIRIPGRATP